MFDLHLRPWTETDIDAHYAAVTESQASLAPWMDWYTPDYSRQSSAEWIRERRNAAAAHQDYEFAVCDRGTMVGAVGVHKIDRARQSAELGYWIRTTRQRQGYATRAVRLLVAHLFETTDLQTIVILVATGNTASLRVCRAAGAERIETLSKRLNLHGTLHDAALFRILRATSELRRA